MKVVQEELLIAIGSQRGKMLVKIWEPDGPSRATVFCIHEFAGSADDFNYLAPILAANGYKVVCPEMIGRGRSAYFGDKKYYVLESYLRTLGVVLEKYYGRVNHVIGSSWGAIIGLVFASVIKMNTGRIILNDPCLQSSGQLDELRATIVDGSSREFTSFDDVVSYLQGIYGIDENFPRERIEEAATGKFIEKDGKWRLAIDPAVVEGVQANIGTDYNAYPHLEKMQVPVLLLFGKQSAYYDKEKMDAIVARNTHITCVSDLDGGHAIPMLTHHTALLVLGFLEARQPSFA